MRAFDSATKGSEICGAEIVQCVSDRWKRNFPQKRSLARAGNSFGRASDRDRVFTSAFENLLGIEDDGRRKSINKRWEEKAVLFRSEAKGTGTI